jgi:SulP family sulfate permease
MSAVLIVLAQKYGLPGVWVAGVMAGIALLIIGLLRLGRFIAYIPAPVITGFTSGKLPLSPSDRLITCWGSRRPPAIHRRLSCLGISKAGICPIGIPW